VNETNVTTNGTNGTNGTTTTVRYHHTYDVGYNASRIPVNASTSFTHFTGAALDLSRRRFYVIDQNLSGIRSMNIDEPDSLNRVRSMKTLVSGMSTTLEGLALDLREAYRHAYFTDPGTPGVADGGIYRVSLDGAQPSLKNLTTKIGTEYLTDPAGIALDLYRGHMYWVDPGVEGARDGRLLRATLSGESVVVICSDLVDPRGVALDLVNTTAYVTDSGNLSVAIGAAENVTTPRVVRVGLSLNYSAYEVLVTSVNHAGEHVPLKHPSGIVLDLHSSTMYWTDTASGFIASAGMIAGASPTVLTSVLKPRGIAFDNGGGYPTEEGERNYVECYGHGVCGGAESGFKCECDDGWYGNCNMRRCPEGRAWFDEATSSDEAHALAPCSNMGVCSTTDGTCICHPGFEGAACERISCPKGSSAAEEEEAESSSCSGHGRCLSMRQAAKLAKVNGDTIPQAYGVGLQGLEDDWDADMIHGCVCGAPDYLNGDSLDNLPSWTGYDCSKRSCVSGDPMTSSPTGLFEVQHMNCSAQAGVFSLSFRSQSTQSIPFDADAKYLKQSLKLLKSIGDVSVSSSTIRGNETVCSSGAFIAIEFLTEFGDLPSMVAHTEGLNGTVVITQAQKGTKGDSECAAHGLCDEGTGVCECFDGFYSSDGDGSVGSRGDCGFQSVATFMSQKP